MKWWQSAVFYQIYPRSFADSSGDGIGDFPGISTRLDYLKDLGIDAIWLSPHFPSPLFDCGYDISDYTSVAPEYGTLADFKYFLDSAHDRNIRVILDLVLNHTSDAHPWFLESRSSKDNPKRDWYIWRDGKNGGPPNNWSSCFDGLAWEFDSQTNQYYYHYFFKQQPDLNWHNPAVKKAMFNAARFWLDLGVDGFRLDAIGTIYERSDLPDHPGPYTLAELRVLGQKATSKDQKERYSDYWREMFQYQVNQPGVHALMKELRSVMDEYPGDRILVGEDEDIAYLGNGEDELHLVFNFPLMRTERITPAHIRKNQQQRLTALKQVNGWPCNTLGNHDSPRVYNRYGDGHNNAALARLHLALLLTLPGTPFLYYGEEIGMTDLYLNDISQFKDYLGIWLYETHVKEPGISVDEAFHHAINITRDKCRTPMQWINAPNAGFCPISTQPWLPANPNLAAGVNVADQENDPASLLNYYRQMLKIRKNYQALQSGGFHTLNKYSRHLLAYLRTTSAQNILVLLNFDSRSHNFEWPKPGLYPAAMQKIIYRSCSEQASSMGYAIQLAPFDVFIAEIHHLES